MDSAYRNQFRCLRVTTPCCDAVSSLNDVIYDWPAGFARYVLEAVNPTNDISVTQLARLAQVLSCSLRKNWAQY
jgi:hypothetical protein